MAGRKFGEKAGSRRGAVQASGETPDKVRSRRRRGMGGAGFEPAKAMPPDLQSGPFNHLGIHPVSGDPSVASSNLAFAMILELAGH